MREMLNTAEWLVTENGFDPARANAFETLLTVGNGYLGTRGTLEEGHLGEVSGTYLAGVYDDHDSPVIDLVNAPDWLGLTVFVDGVRLDVRNCSVAEHERTLDLRSGLLHRRTVFVDAAGRRTRLETLRCASVADRHVCALRAEITPENHDAEVVVESALDGRRRNFERLPVYPPGTSFPPAAKWEKWSRTKHLERTARDVRDEVLYLEMRTVSSGVSLGYAAITTATPAPAARRPVVEDERVAQLLTFAPTAGRTIRLDKLVGIHTSRDPDATGADLRSAGRATLRDALDRGFDGVVADSRTVWDSWWDDCDVEIVGDATRTHAVRCGIYHLLIAANGTDPTVNIGAKSLSGEGYRGHVFWDTEIMMLPFFIYTRPGTARNLLAYRHHTLPGARGNAARELAAIGTGSDTGSDTRTGARFAWESADTGREECPEATPDGSFRFWARDEEVHVTADVAYGVMRYVEATGDRAFLHDLGAEVLFETSRYWVGRVEADGDGRYRLRTVMGPDEFHSHVDDNAFTNHLVRWHLEAAAAVHDEFRTSAPEAYERLARTMRLDADEASRWRDVARRLRVPGQRADGLVEQFDGYFDRLDVPITEWDANGMPRYPAGYHHFNCEDTTLLKQPDVVMLMYVLPDAFDLATKRANFEYYEERTLHKSSLSPSIHAIMGIEVGDTSRAEQYFTRSATVDLADNQGNTEEGMHIASAGGTWQALVCGFGGFRVTHGRMTFKPWLPAHWDALRFRLRWHGNRIRVDVGHDQITFLLDAPPGITEQVQVSDDVVLLQAGTPTVVPLHSTIRRDAPLGAPSYS
jgi:kojibiose phosphorylase